MNQRSLNRAVHNELDDLVALKIIEVKQVEQIKLRYPTEAWNMLALVRSFTVLGVLTCVAGILILLREHMNWWLMGEATLAGSFLGGLALAHWLKTHRNMPILAEALELASGMALQGLSIVLALHHSSGSKNWPALVGVDAALLLALAYALANRLLLWYSLALFFFFCGAETGYISGWGAYYLGMTYPARFLAIGAGVLCLAWVHVEFLRGRLAPFARVYFHYGLLLINLSLWFLSVFGYYENQDVRWDDTEGERLAFSILWAAVAGGSVWASVHFNLQLLRGYAYTFLMINLYTFYFQFLVSKSPSLWFIHLLLVGGSLLGLGIYVDGQRKKEPAQNE
ncbi:hypothetical protein ACO0LM_20000 [Undibacterium sp. Di26W]|uniref:hypothetical protein n=1 Tax=Undibacterium sp. Di26W TaxID=3413035 RepID=UPI003BEFC1FB